MTTKLSIEGSQYNEKDFYMSEDAVMDLVTTYTTFNYMKTEIEKFSSNLGHILEEWKASHYSHDIPKPVISIDDVNNASGAYLVYVGWPNRHRKPQVMFGISDALQDRLVDHASTYPVLIILRIAYIEKPKELEDLLKGMLRLQA